MLLEKDAEQMKICPKCNVKKHADDFGYMPNGKYLRSYCRQCDRDYRAAMMRKRRGSSANYRPRVTEQKASKAMGRLLASAW